MVFCPAVDERLRALVRELGQERVEGRRIHVLRGRLRLAPLLAGVLALARRLLEGERLVAARDLNRGRVEGAELEDVLAPQLVGRLLHVVEQRRVDGEHHRPRRVLRVHRRRRPPSCRSSSVACELPRPTVTEAAGLSRPYGFRSPAVLRRDRLHLRASARARSGPRPCRSRPAPGSASSIVHSPPARRQLDRRPAPDCTVEPVDLVALERQHRLLPQVERAAVERGVERPGDEEHLLLVRELGVEVAGGRRLVADEQPLGGARRRPP